MKVRAQKEQEGAALRFETGTPYAVPLYGPHSKWGELIPKEETTGGIVIHGTSKGSGKEGPLPGVVLTLSVEEALALYVSLGSRLEEVKEHYRIFPYGPITPKQ
jgi:hypothetical protein